MGVRRGFSPDVVESDRFLEMPASTRALYFQLGMHAGDDGRVGNPRGVQRMVRSNDDDLRILIGKGFISMADDGSAVMAFERGGEASSDDGFEVA